jgi:hypothetical protein
MALAAVLPAAQGLWTQAGGDPARASFVDTGPGPWDIVSSFDALAPDQWMIRINGPGFVETPHGLAGVSRHRETDACSLTRILDPLAGRTETVPLDGLSGCWMAGYSERHDLLLVCRGDDLRASGLTAYDARTLALRWSLSAVDVFHVQGQPVHGLDPTPGNDAEPQAGCLMGAIDDELGEFVAPWPSSRWSVDFPSHRIAAVALEDGAVRWSVTVPTSTLLRQRAPTSLPWPDGTGVNWVPLSTALTSSGILVAGIALCPDLTSCDDPRDSGDFLPIRQVNAWLDRSGSPIGALWSEGDPGDLAAGGAPAAFDGYSGGSVWASAVGPLAYALVGDEVVQVDPQDPNPRLRATLAGAEGLPTGYSGPMGPIPHKGNLLLFLERTVSRVDPATGQALARWPGLGSGWLGDWHGLATAGGEVLWEVVERAACDPPLDEPATYQTFACPHRIVVLDADTLELRQALPHPGSIMPVYLEPGLEAPALGYLASLRVPAWAVPAQDRVLYGDVLGHVTVLARSDPQRAPLLSASTLYPEAGAAVRLDLRRADLPDAAHVIVHWGEARPDGQAFIEEAAWPQDRDTLTFEHAYVKEGRADALVTAVAADGTTRTRQLAFDVGGRPPSGPPDALPQPEARPEFPPPGTAVEVILQPPRQPAVELFADWADGTVERHAWRGDAPLALQHVYREPGPKRALFTAIFLDGTTATRVVDLDVGGSPPPSLSFVQRRLSPENQEVTFFVLGLAITAFGGAMGYLGHRRSRSKIRQHLHELAAIRRRAWEDPQGALGEVIQLRRRLDDELSSGRLAENQYHLVHDKAGVLLAQLVPRAVEHGEALSGPFRARLESVFQDGRLDRAELASVLRLLDQETALTSPQRQQLRRLVESLVAR